MKHYLESSRPSPVQAADYLMSIGIGNPNEVPEKLPVPEWKNSYQDPRATMPSSAQAADYLMRIGIGNLPEKLPVQRKLDILNAEIETETSEVDIF